MRTAYFPLTLVIQNTKSEIEKLCYQNGTLTCAKPMSQPKDSSSGLKEGVKGEFFFFRRKSRQGSGPCRRSFGSGMGSIFAPGANPSFYITVNESALSIEFRHRSGASLQVLDMKATVSVRAGTVVEESEAITFNGSDKQALITSCICIQ